MFIPAAEKDGLIIPLGRWVMREACSQIKQWLEDGIAPPSTAINLSIVQFQMAVELENAISATLTEFALPAESLELELTESVLMKAAGEHNELLPRLRNKGHRIAIDDFGKGYSSLDYLRRYPVDRIKIDQSFIENIGTAEGNDAIVRAIVGLARELHLEVVAEGVETAAQFALLKSWGCRIVQGYYFSRPLAVPEITALLRVGNINSPSVNPARIVTAA
jgi:EAL domain-containing protein (putative c-di-GMP-specific phosphodiesterase class I)